MPTRLQIVSFDDSPPPPGLSAWVEGAAPTTGITMAGPDPAWPQRFTDLAGRIRAVFGPDSPEVVRHRILRDWLRAMPDERARYAAAKLEAATAAKAGGEHVEQYNARKEQVLREIYHRAFLAADLIDE
jgi:GrpB-like predicted nucleotidyltransferase (UPF0157 family)